MKALTLHQPWATLIALGVKRIETRSWRAPQALIGQRIAIHAGKALTYLDGDIYGDYIIATDDCDRARMQRLDESEIRGGLILPLGAIVATATLTDYLPMVDTDHRGHHLRSLLICPSGLFRSDRSSQDDDYDLTDQLPYGWFAPGRWAWMLDDIKLCDLVPAKGKQGVWEWLP